MSYSVNFTFKDLLNLYEKYKDEYGNTSYKYISKLLMEAKKYHKEAFRNSDEANKKISRGEAIDHEQS